MRQVFHTAGDPPRSGRAIFVNKSSTQKSRNALVSAANAKIDFHILVCRALEVSQLAERLVAAQRRGRKIGSASVDAERSPRKCDGARLGQCGVPRFRN